MDNETSAVLKETERRKAAEKKLAESLADLEKARAQAATAGYAKSQFLANMSHEIRTPMNVILGFAEILETRLTDRQDREYAAVIHQAARSLMGIINNLLDLSRIESGKLTLWETPSDPRVLLTDIHRMFLPKFENKGLPLRLVIAPETPPTVAWDETRIRQILMNLLDNSLKFTPSGRVTLSIETAAQTKNLSSASLVLSVKDTGIGIPENQHEAVFEPFEKRPDPEILEQGGMGLGLSISRQLAERMGGRILLESAPGRGSHFRVVFDAVRIPATPDIETACAETASGDCVDFDPSTMLIADDVKTIHQLIKGYLAPFGFQFLDAHNGLEAVALARTHRPDLILMDMKMPAADGCTALETLRADPVTRGIPVIAITASILKESEDRLRKLFNGFLRKPFNRAQLITLLAGLLPHRRVSGPVEAARTTEKKPDDGVFQADPAPLADWLNKECLPKALRLKEVLIIDEIEAFGKQTSETARSFGCAPLREWAERLLTGTTLMDVAMIEDALDDYFPLVNTMIQQTAEAAS